MEDWQTGDIRAFEDFYRRYEKMVFKSAYLITGSRQDADDILQEVFASVWRSRRTYDPSRGTPATWLHRITVNACHRRRRTGRPTLPLEDSDLADTKAGPEERLEKRMEHDRLLEAMGTLGSKHRIVLVLRYFNDLSYEEISRVVGVPLGTVKSRINTALKMLRTRMGDQEGG